MKTPFHLMIVALALTGCGGNDPSSDPNIPHDIAVTQGASGKGASAFSPANFTLSLASQTRVTWLNRDVGSGGYGNNGVTHRLASDDGTSFSSGNIPPNGTFVATMSAPGTYVYHCSIHPTMTGTVTVNP
jgi:plastocyanin